MASAGRGAKIKGCTYERETAKAFTKWWKEGNLEGEFYKTPASGGLRWKARSDVIGDLCAPEGFLATVECKNCESWDYRELFGATEASSATLIKVGPNKGRPNSPTHLGEFWFQACDEGQRAKKVPLLIFTKNHHKDLVMMPEECNAGIVYHDVLKKVGVYKTFVVPVYRPYMEKAIILRLSDFFSIVEPKMFWSANV
jgi:hypothetical protein